MLMNICKRCGALVPYPHTYCDTCQQIVDKVREEAWAKSKKASDQRYNQRRDPKYLRFYQSSDWKILSQKYLQDKGYRCEGCHRIATEVHHKQPIQTPEGWERRLDYTNLEAVCKDCHNKRHHRFQAKGKRKPSMIDKALIKIGHHN